MEAIQSRFAIGQQYQTRGKRLVICTIVDIHTTYNAIGDVVKVRYVATHEFMGQTVTDRDVLVTTVAMGLIDA